MRKIVFTVLMMFFSVFASLAQDVSGWSGSGTASNPYQLATRADLELLATRDSVAHYEQMLDAARADFKQMLPRENGQTNQAYYAQQRTVMEMERHFDELCAKVKFYLRKIDIDKQDL